MISYKKILLYTKDFIFQTIVFYLIFISSLGNLGWKIGIFEKPKYHEIIYESEISTLPILISYPYYFLLFYIGTMLYSIVPILVNIYFIRINKFRILESDYVILKILFMILANLGYLLSWMLIYSELIYRDLMYPIVITLFTYLTIFVFRKQRNCESPN
jgi:hypothetical protein